jgi:1-acyl-sn-glycerol-3-phosphate acyltransferase
MSARQPVVLEDRPVQLQGYSAARAALKLAGWQLSFNGLPAKQGVVIVYPHTSNWDLVVGMFAKWGMGLPATFFGKDTLFNVPVLGAWLRWVGGMPVDRASPHGVVGQMVQRLQQAKQRDEFFWLVIAPEGTRSYGSHWRSGFYQVALKAAVPLGLAYIDFGRKQVGIDSFVALSGDEAADMTAIAQHLGHRTGKRPDQAAPICLRDDSSTTTP